MRTADKVMAFCVIPRTAQELADHCKIQRSSIYSQLERLQVKGLLKRFGREPAMYVVAVPVEVVIEENLVIKHAHNPFGLRT
jgi:sugar-specific transcriptional regulator TrmB